MSARPRCPECGWLDRETGHDGCAGPPQPGGGAIVVAVLGAFAQAKVKAARWPRR